MLLTFSWLKSPRRWLSLSELLSPKRWPTKSELLFASELPMEPDLELLLLKTPVTGPDWTFPSPKSPRDKPNLRFELEPNWTAWLAFPRVEHRFRLDRVWLLYLSFGFLLVFLNRLLVFWFSSSVSGFLVLGFLNDWWLPLLLAGKFWMGVVWSSESLGLFRTDSKPRFWRRLSLLWIKDLIIFLGNMFF